MLCRSIVLYSLALTRFRDLNRGFDGLGPIFIVKNLKSRWGSATKGNTINLNLNLLKASEDIINYIVLHEISHLKIKEHSHHFWSADGQSFDVRFDFSPILKMEGIYTIVLYLEDDNKNVFPATSYSIFIK